MVAAMGLICHQSIARIQKERQGFQPEVSGAKFPGQILQASLAARCGKAMDCPKNFVEHVPSLERKAYSTLAANQKSVPYDVQHTHTSSETGSNELELLSAGMSCFRPSPRQRCQHVEILSFRSPNTNSAQGLSIQHLQAQVTCLESRADL